MKLKSALLITSLTGATAVGYWSCKDSFLDKQPLATVLDATYYSTEKEASDAVIGVYSIMQKQAAYGMNLPSFIDGAGDDILYNAYANADQNFIIRYNISPDNGALNDTWRNFYTGIVRANLLIDKVPKAQFDEKVRNRIIGEAKALRAFYYFHLVNLFGDVPLVITPLNTSPEAIKTPRTPVTQVYTQIEKDLTEAIAVLPKKSQYASSDLGRVTQGTAQALLANAYLFQKKYQQAADMSAQVIASGEYSLVPDYYANFTLQGENGPESVFELQESGSIVGGWTDDNLGNDIHMRYRPGCNGEGGWGGFVPAWTLEQAFETGDKRKGVTVILPGDKFQGTTFDCRAQGKHWTPGERKAGGPRDDANPLNYPLIRYAEVLLINAEANAELGKLTDAATPLNLVRKRAGLAATTATTQDALRTAVRQERRVEFGNEAKRLYDLRRWGIVVEAIKSVYGESGIQAKKHELFPIPQQQIDLSEGALTQNPGY